MSKSGFATWLSGRKAAKSLLVGLTAACLVLNLTGPVLADPLPITPSTNTNDQAPTVHSTDGQAPVIDITTPNGAGVSHNVYTDFNVNPEGMVFNNSTTGTENSELRGGTLWANPNLTGGSAGLILNEVTGKNLSQLLGYMEVYGNSADLVVANPNGITCNGCGFYNIPRATLTTGTPIWGSDGSLAGFDVDGGKITIEQTEGLAHNFGADITGVQYFDIIARSIQISGLIEDRNYASSNSEIGLFAGRNAFDYGSRTATAKADDGSEKPEFGIDSSLLGGAYAHKITIIGTENGVGVKTPADMRAAYGGISLTADGKIVFGKTRSQGGISATTSSQIEIAQQVWSETALELTAGGNISVLDNVRAGARGDVALATNSLDLNTGAFAGAGMDEDGTFVAGGLLTIEAAALTNHGTLQSGQDIAITVTGTATNSGSILAPGTLALLGGSVFSNEATGVISGDGGVELGVASASNAGSIQSSAGNVTATVSGDLDNSGSITSNTRTSVTAGSLSNDGTIASEGQLVADIAGDLTNTAQMTAGQDATLEVGGELINDLGAEIRAAGLLSIDAASLMNVGAIDEAVTDGLIGGQDIVIRGGEVINAGSLLADRDMTITATDLVANVLGRMIAGGDIGITAENRFENLSGVVRGRNVSIIAEEIVNVTLVKRDDEVIIPKEFAGVLRADTTRKIDQAVKEYQTTVAEKFGLAEEKLFDALREQLGEEALTDAVKEKIRSLLKENNSAQVPGAAEDVTQNVTQAVRTALYRNATSGQLSQDVSNALSGSFLHQQDMTATENALIAALKKTFKDNPRLDAVETKVRSVLSEVFKDTASADQAENRIIAAIQEGLAANGGSGNSAFSALRGAVSTGTAAPGNNTAKAKQGFFGLFTGNAASVDNHTDTSAGTAEISATGDVTLKANKDITDVGGKTTAGGDVTIDAGGNVNITAQQLSMVNNRGISGGHDNRASITNQRSELEAGGDITITAGEDARLKGVGVTSGGDTTLVAKGDVELSGAKDETHTDYYKKKSGFLGFNKSVTVEKTDELKTVQTTIKAGGKVDIVSEGKDVVASATTMEAKGNIRLKSDTGNVVLKGDRNVTITEKYKKNSSWWGLTGSTNASYDSADLNEPSFVSAEGDVILDSAAGDLIINGSVVQARQDIFVHARNVYLQAAENIIIHNELHKKSGFFFDVFAGNGSAGFSAGFRTEKDTLNDTQRLAQVSALIANGTILIEADDNFVSQGAQLFAGTDLIARAGKDITLETAYDIVSHTESHKVKQVGVTVSAGENVSSAVKTLANAPKNFNAGEGSTLNKRITQASTALQAIDAVYGLVTGPLVSVNASLGVSSSASSASSTGQYAHVGVMQAGRDIELTAGSDLDIVGTQIEAARFLVADAGDDLRIQSALSQIHERSASRQRNASVGVSAGLGFSGFSVSGNVSAGFQNSKSNAETVLNSNAQLKAGGTVTLKSGQDTLVAGARVEGRDVVAEVGGSLNVESRQDTYTSRSSTRGANVSVSVGLGGSAVPDNALESPRDAISTMAQNTKDSLGKTYDNGIGGSQKTGTLGITYGKGERDKAWTEEQTAIVATNSIDLTVGGNTHLKGSVVNTESGNLRIDTATLTYEDIQDYDRAENLNVSLSLSYSWGGAKGKDGKPLTPAQRAAAGNVFETSAFKAEGTYEKTAKEGISRATVGEGEIGIRDTARQADLEASGKTGKLAALNRDLDKAQEVTKEERSYVKLYVSDTSIKAVGKIVEKAADFLEKLVDDGGIAGDKENLREFIIKNKDKIDEGTVISCISPGEGGKRSGSLLDFIFTPAHAEVSDSCVIRFKGAKALYKDYEDGIRISAEDHAKMRQELADGFLREASSLIATLDSANVGDADYQAASHRLVVVLGYFALCSDGEEWISFVNSNPFLQNNNKYVNLAQGNALSTEVFMARYGYFSTKDNPNSADIAKLRDEHPQMYSTFVEGQNIYIDGNLTNANNSIDGMIILLSVELTKTVQATKIIDGQEVTVMERQPFLMEDERYMATQIAARLLVSEETKLPVEHPAIYQRIVNFFWQKETDSWGGIPPEDFTYTMLEDVKSYMRSDVFKAIGAANVRLYASEHDRAMGAWMPYVEDAVGGTWHVAKSTTAYVWNGTKWVAEGIGSGTQSGYEGTIDWVGSGVTLVYGDETGDSFRKYALAAEAPVKGTVQFGWGFTVGAIETGGHVVGGTGDLLGNIYAYGEYGDYRGYTNDQIADAASYVWNNPEDASTKLGIIVDTQLNRIWDDGVKAYENGQLPYYLGYGTGETTVIVGSFFLAPETLGGKFTMTVDATSAMVRGERADEILAATAEAGNILKYEGGLARSLDDLRYGACFVAGTIIWTQDGMRPIETIQIGDLIVSRDRFAYRTLLKPVVRLFKNTSPHALHLTLERADGKIEVVTTTKGHPFHVPGRGFVFAGKLRPGDLITSGGHLAQAPLLLASSKDNDVSGVLRVKALSIEDHATTVYNFEVADTHTYFVGRSRAWVHNQSSSGMFDLKSASPKSLISRQMPEEMTGSQVKRLVKDMKANGYKMEFPVDVANVNGRWIILDGHHRALAAAKAGIPNIPVRVFKVTKEEGQRLLQEAAEAMQRRGR